MPTYVYEVINEDGSDGDRFEVQQRMSEPALTKHPETGQPVRRVITAANVITKSGLGSATVASARARDLGFTQYKKTSDGTYEKTFGHGPDQMKKPPR